ncbi:Cof-like hydrolase [Thermaerobacter marianensis DSM 12885]|uniref:Cof-like hydrolase n=1 Tax=Thermaerobacter marianensis (strain ATCC 700841 / DSM 12885 / JCM 10246 / 7p75a) TaxID=644966 RepID=E6SLP0_THEM7|nr:Cof-type HAD-IIB family hydrolase [Thermaerobacter marianensis]ADU50307.1 Cof-like hydrolase [Thermaerobacter marianensis DSM 12885]
MLPYLIALDVDGTLLDSGGRLRPRVKNAVRAAVDAGHYVVLATGRRWVATRPFAQELGLKAPCIVHNGAVAVDPLTDQPVWRQPLPTEFARQAILKARELGVSLFFHDLDHPHGDRMLYEPGARLPKASWFFEAGRLTQEVPDLMEWLQVGAVRVLVRDRQEGADAFRRWITAEWGDAVRVLAGTDLEPGIYAVEVSDAPVCKGWALERLAAHLQIPVERVVAVGDWDNDIEMLQFAGLGVAMANGSPAARAAARRVTASNDEDGVAVVLEELLGGGVRGGVGGSAGLGR